MNFEVLQTVLILLGAVGALSALASTLAGLLDTILNFLCSLFFGRSLRAWLLKDALLEALEEQSVNELLTDPVVHGFRGRPGLKSVRDWIRPRAPHFVRREHVMNWFSRHEEVRLLGPSGTPAETEKNRQEMLERWFDSFEAYARRRYQWLIAYWLTFVAAATIVFGLELDLNGVTRWATSSNEGLLELPLEEGGGAKTASHLSSRPLGQDASSKCTEEMVRAAAKRWAWDFDQVVARNDERDLEHALLVRALLTDPKPKGGRLEALLTRSSTIGQGPEGLQRAMQELEDAPYLLQWLLLHAVKADALADFKTRIELFKRGEVQAFVRLAKAGPQVIACLREVEEYRRRRVIPIPPGQPFSPSGFALLFLIGLGADFWYNALKRLVLKR